MHLKVCHLYSDLLNLHGDRGNVLIFCRRAEWRGIRVELDLITRHEKVSLQSYDFIFLGGGTDQGQELVSRDLQAKGPFLLEAAESGAVILGISAGYQLLGRSYQRADGALLPGVGLFDLYTEAGTEMLRGNILLEIAADIQQEIEGIGSSLTTLIGFENHAGRTYLGKNAKPLANVLKGYGNNGEDGTEGACYKNAFGTYLHGPLLAKNPHLADLLIAKALSRRYGQVPLQPLDDHLELSAHNIMKKRLQ